MEKFGVYTAYKLMVDDFLQLIEFVAPSKNNYDTFSHRLYQLQFRIATEFENICKIIIRDKFNGSPCKNIMDYHIINSTYNLHKYNVGLLFALPKTYNVRPFKQWRDGHSLFWYQSYNNVKHDRNKNFEEANYRNVVYSLSALHLLLFKYYEADFFNPFNRLSGVTTTHSDKRKSTRYEFPNTIFSVTRLS